MLYEKEDNKRVRCHLCAHRCLIANLKFGVCSVRENIDGTLFTYAYGVAAAVNVDPIEKKPLYHFLPGSKSYSFCTRGCNFKCGFCQNWQISQLSANHNQLAGYKLLPEEIVSEAKKNDCRSISYTYTEPTMFFEYAYETARLAVESGLRNVFVTNGYITREAVDMIEPYLHAANIDLKSFQESYYRKNCKAHLKPVLDSIRYMKNKGIWIEITTLIVPGENDSDEELKEISRFIAQVDMEIPWHVTAFHPDYKFSDYPATSADILLRAYEIGKAEGLHYVYPGNIFIESNTHCHRCGQLLVKRKPAEKIVTYLSNARCPSCGIDIHGIWQ